MKNLAAIIDRKIAKDQPPIRSHLGCSILGHPCDRYIWLSFRWAVAEYKSGRMLRLLDRGSREEPVMIELLRKAGAVISDAEHQLGVILGDHVSGHIDAIINGGLPGYEDKRMIVEIKTHSEKSFRDLVAKGVEKSKPTHFVQMQLYMMGSGIRFALYAAVCKNNDELHFEVVEYDDAVATKYLDRGVRLASQDQIPPPIGGPSWYQCQMCAYRSFCHGPEDIDRTTKNINCRTCAHSTAGDDWSWHCERHGKPLNYSRQVKGCQSHVFHPDLVPWKMLDPVDQWTAVYEIDGQAVANGEPCANIFSSQEILDRLTGE